MAHTVRHQNMQNTAISQVTFTSYTSGIGGEQFQLSEFGLTGSLVGVFFLDTVNAVDGTENPEKYCKYMGAGKIMLMNPATPDAELPTANTMNLTVFAIVQGS